MMNPAAVADVAAVPGADDGPGAAGSPAAGTPDPAGDGGAFEYTSGRGWRWAGRKTGNRTGTWIMTAPGPPPARQYAVICCPACAGGAGYAACTAPGGVPGNRDIAHAATFAGVITAVEDDLVRRSAALRPAGERTAA